MAFKRTFVGTFVRGALDKVGIDPQVKRIGNYKSAGDQLLREEMSVYQKEQLQDLLDDIYNGVCLFHRIQIRIIYCRVYKGGRSQS